MLYFLIAFLKNKTNEAQTSSLLEKINMSIEQLVNCEAIIQHKLNSSLQREAYKFQRKSKEFLKNKVFIDLDFKQKIIIGLSPIQVNSEYYNLENRTLLGKLFFLLI